ncbi:DgyrCDS7207 [Dimorphilus gyrociliatus]|uniref:DgyrCDS7207 n=1 Tax=Dimorphilus gyrociliatus TaxID=2664684 RepID=A0A7I8VS44_9ANNE|nr:DgyrCDS7207 [Dimorphilus gyrociliatus]
MSQVYVVAVTTLKDLQREINKLLGDKIILKAYGTNEEIVSGDLEKAEIVITEPRYLLSSKLFDKCPNLKWFHSPWAGVECILKYDWTKNRPIITRTVGSYPQQMSEWAIGNMIASNRNFFAMKKYQLDHKWGKQDFRNFCSLYGKSIAILGCGSIGKELARKAKVFDMTVWAITKSSHEKCNFIDHHRHTNDLDEVLSNCDFICNVMPQTEETRGLLSGKRLSVCKKQPLFLNMGRGSIISDESLCEALDEKWIQGAVLDVFNEEPLPPSNKLYDYPNVFVTHHTAGVTFANEVADDFAHKFEQYTSKKAMDDVVQVERGY